MRWSVGWWSIAVAAIVVVAVPIEAGAVPVIGDGRVRVTGEALPASSPGLDTTAAGITVPALRVTNPRGEKTSIPRDGLASVLLFVNRHGAASRRQTAALRDWFDEGFSLPQDAAYSTIWFPRRTESHGRAPRWLGSWPMPVLRDSPSRAAAAAFGAAHSPMWVLVDRSGALVARYSGFLDIENLAELLYRFGMVPRPGAAVP